MANELDKVLVADAYKLPFSRPVLIVYVRHFQPERSKRVREWWVEVVPEHLPKRVDYFHSFQQAPIEYLGCDFNRSRVIYFYNADQVHRTLLEITNCRLLYSAIAHEPKS